MKTVDLFAGCGGLSQGMINAGFSVVAAIDNWDPALEVYRANFRGHPTLKHDLSDIESTVAIINELKPRIIVGGPPCQDFSTAGPRAEGARANLTVAFAEIVASVRPEWFVMENVARAYKSTAYKLAEKKLVQAGYGVTPVILNASYCGVPQRRKRFFCIGKHGENDGFLSETIDALKSDAEMTVRQYFGGRFPVEHYYRHPRNYTRRAVFSIDEPAPTVRGVNRPVPKGYKRHAGDTADPKSIRPLSTEERAMLQTFPSSFNWIGTKTAKEQMIGNAVPVGLAEFVARCVLGYKKRKSNG
jgi:DNA (cytosine-5)-methyltransferase 1